MVSPSFRKLFTFYSNRNNLWHLLQSRKKLNVIVLTVWFLVEKIKRSKLFFKSASLHFSHVWKKKKQKQNSKGSNFACLIRQMSINQKIGRKTFRGRFVSGSLFVSPCPPECYFHSETKIEPNLGLFCCRYSIKTKILSMLGTGYSFWNRKN